MTSLPTGIESPGETATALERIEAGHVLLADGDRRARGRRSSQLRTAGFRVSLARTGFEAIVKATCHVPDVIVVSESLPDLDASETSRLISTCPVTAHIPVLTIISGRGLARRIQALLRQPSPALT